MSVLISCQNLTKNYSGVRALDQFSLEIDVKEATGLVGANGAGKSTLFSILCGFLRPSAGKVDIMGHAPSASSLKGKISILPQDTAMYRNISVNAQLEHYARLQGFDKQAARRETRRVLDRVTATAQGPQYPETLSFGQRKKVMLAQALIGKPELILLDEPTSGLDPVATRAIHQLLEELASDYSVIISSHNLAEIEGICRQIVVINRGKLVKSGSIADIKRVSQCFRLTLTRQPDTDLVALLATIPAVSRVEAEGKDGRCYQVYYEKGKAHDVQIAILSELSQVDIEIAEISQGSALADEISNLLQP